MSPILELLASIAKIVADRREAAKEGSFKGWFKWRNGYEAREKNRDDRATLNKSVDQLVRNQKGGGV